MGYVFIKNRLKFYLPVRQQRYQQGLLKGKRTVIIHIQENVFLE
jgi:hypothetical protein